MALCDSHVAGCGEHLPAWGLRDDRIPGTAQAVRGGRHGQKLHSGFPPRGRWMPAAVRMPAVVRMPACHSRRFKGERPNRRRHRPNEPTTKALCQTPPLYASLPQVQNTIQPGKYMQSVSTILAGKDVYVPLMREALNKILDRMVEFNDFLDL